MRLKRVEMLGFKSFAQKTVVELTPGVTSIVGPNGCGKSNIVDALRWAMGEQSARHLRGHLMEDVVFNGSDSLPPTGMAEVSLTFDNEDGRGPVDYNTFSEIMVTRRLFRSGESEYAINKTPCRLKDVVELFLGTGVGSKAYSIVEQGRVDELVNAKPEERRALIEESAGTSKFKSRKLVAERKLERTQQNLLRLNDIVREIERQIRSMELQAKKAERYRALKSELREKDLGCAALFQQQLSQEIARSQSDLAGAENRMAEQTAALHAKEAESEGVRLSLMESEKAIAAQQESVYQQKVQIQAHEQKIDFYGKDLAQLERSEADAGAALTHLEGRLKLLAQEITELSSARASFVQLSLFEETQLREKENELVALQARLLTLQGELEREKESLIEAANQIAYLKNDLSAGEKRRAEIATELARCETENAGAAAALARSEQKSIEARRDLELVANQGRSRSLEAAQATAAIEGLCRSREEQERKVESLKEQIQESRSRFLSLEDLQRNYEGYQEGVRAIMLKRQKEPSPNGVYGLVADVIEAPEPFEKALTAVLGDRLQYIIVKGQEEGVESIEYLKRQATGRGSFIPLQLSRKQVKPLPLDEAEVVAPLLEMVAVKEGYRDVAEYLLSDVVVVKDLMAGLALWNRNGFYCTLVTTAGEVIDSIGVVTGGSDASLDRGIFTQRRRIRELAIIVQGLEEQLFAEDRALSGFKEELAEAETKKKLLGGEIHRLELERVRLEHEARSADQECQRLTQAAETLGREQGELTKDLEVLDGEIRQGRESAETRLKEKTAREQFFTAKQSAAADLKNAAESLEAAVTQSRIRHAALSEKHENTHLNLDNRLKLQAECAAEAAGRRGQIEDILRRQAEIEQAMGESQRTLDQGRAALNEMASRLQAERQGYRNISMKLAEIEESIKELRPLGEPYQEERSRAQLALAEKRMSLQHLAENLREKYDVGLETLASAPPEGGPSRAELQAEIDDLRGRLERMGEVNLAAIGEYEELTTRFQFMSRQKEDLEKSIADLQQTIVKLNRVCRLRFKESFEQINEKFETVFPRLFSGGKARLVLTDENDFLETGVDIIVQPPGKKLQSITLLSGGEKALTAVSLLFAIFLTKPSPFCFLDEVDAPLDDANLDRFNDMIKEMSEFSQFVLVTHNKKTMQAAEMLYGITMAESGVSKLVSVRMS